MFSNLCAFGKSFLLRSFYPVQRSTPSRVPSLTQIRTSTPSRFVCLHSSLREPLSWKYADHGWNEDSSEKPPVVEDPNPTTINLLEALESFFLFASLVFQLIPILDKSTAQFRAPSAPTTITTRTTSDGKKQTEEQVLVTSVVDPSKGLGLSPKALEILPLFSFGALFLAVLFGSFVRRFQRYKMTQYTPQIQPSQILTRLERDELDQQISRAFAEISQLTGQLERLRVKVRLVSSEYGPIIEATAQDSSRLRSSVRTLGDQIKDLDKHLSEVDKVLLKLEGVVTKQFEIVSFALRRIDSDCKELKKQLNPVVEMKETL